MATPLETHKTPFPFYQLRYFSLLFSGVILLGGIFLLTSGREFKLGIDFQGGLLIQILASEKISMNELRQVMDKAGGGEIQDIVKGEGREFLLRVNIDPSLSAKEQYERTEEIKKIIHEELLALRGKQTARFGRDLHREDDLREDDLREDKLRERPGHTAPLSQTNLNQKNSFIEFRKVSFVGPRISEDLRGQAVALVFWAIAIIILYVTVRFEWKFAVSALITTLHDVLFILAVVLMTGKEIDIPLIAAILTVVGYSINDTIVVFDRIRENFPLLRYMKYTTMVEKSIQDTLSRTIITSLTTFLAVLTLYLRGGEAISGFTFALLLGIVIGTYSTIFVACPLVILFRRRT